jgi:uncharacterized Zn finger protein
VRENAEAKGRRYLAEARLIVEYVDDEEIRATCRGGGAVHTLGYAKGRWSCTCPAKRDACCHLAALRLVTRRPAT